MRRQSLKKSLLSTALALFILSMGSIASAITVSDGIEAGKTYTATETDESAVDVSGTTQAEITGAVIEKTAGEASSADASSFRGVNSAVRVYDNAELTITDSEITASASNATGVFAYR